jgi:uncharacterized protein DUF3526
MIAAFQLSFWMELRLLGRQPATWIILGLFTTLCTYSTILGASVWRRTTTSGQSARDESAHRLARWKQETATGHFVTSGARGSRADSPYFVSAERLPYSIAPHPLGMLQASELAARTWVDDLRAWSSEPDLFQRDDLANPLLLQSGALDTNLLIVFLLPVVLGALAMRGQVQDRADEIHRWVHTLSGLGGSVMAGKLGAVLLIALIPAISSLIISIAAGGADLAATPSAARWLALTAAYAFLWLVLFAWLARAVPHSSGYMLGVCSIWIGFALLAPLARVLLLDRIAPPPDPGSSILERQAIDLRMKEFHGSAEEFVRRQHPNWFGTGIGDAREISILASFLLAEDELLRNREAALEVQRARAALSQRLAWLSPCLLASDALARVTGSDGKYFEAQRARVNLHLRGLREFLFPMIFQGSKMNKALYDQLPVFNMESATGAKQM